MSQEHSLADPLGPLAEEFVARFRKGERPSLSEYIEKYPELAEQIKEIFPLLVVMEEAGSGIASAPASSTAHHVKTKTPAIALPDHIGGYRIQREIGRGGMGVVYEAEQLALGRHVALKVLPLQNLKDEASLRRFRQEARVAARLHHTNIVPVFEVGEDQGICFYAMQYIQGQALDQVLDELRQIRQHVQTTQPHIAPPTDSEGASLSHEVALSLLSGFDFPVVRHKKPEESEASGSDVQTPGTQIVSKPLLPGQSERSQVGTNRFHYFRSVARVGIQVAEALEYAHREGVLHRDIKPSNLLLDTHSRVWITDFGLAKTEEMALTRHGDIIGTLRYMAPERFRGKADARSDVFSLGLTLYEMLLLRPAFDSPDRLALMHQVAHQQPLRLRLFDPQIPRDLETIVNKSIEKDPGRRYQTAAELAGDLQRFLDHKPIRARRISLLEHGWSWCRRNPVVSALIACVLLVALLGVAGIVVQWQNAVANERRANQNAERAEEKEAEAKQQRDEARGANARLRTALDRLKRITYSAQLNLAKNAWDAGGVARVRELLHQHEPKDSEEDLRGFEWYYLRRLCAANPHTLTGHGNPVVSVAASPDGKRIASVCMGRTLRVWDAKTGRTLYWAGPHPGAYPYDVAFSPDGEQIATCADDKTIKFFDAATGKHLRTLTGHTEGVFGIAFSPDGKKLASVSGSAKQAGQLKLWNVASGGEEMSLNDFSGGTGVLSFSADGRLLAAVHQRHTVKILDTTTNKIVQSFQPTKLAIYSLALSPDGKQIAVTTTENRVQIWDVRAGKQIRTLKGHTRAILSVAYRPDGKRLASAGERIHVWDSATGKHLRTLKGHQKPIRRIIFSADGKQIISASYDESVRIWNAQLSTEPLTFTAHPSDILGVAVSPDGKSVATSARDRDIRLWNVQTGDLIRTFGGARIHCHNIVFSPDGKRLAAASLDRHVYVWDVATAKLDGKFEHKSGVLWLSFLPDSKHLATSPLDRHVYVWDLQTGKRKWNFSIKGHPGAMRTVAFSADGKLAASTTNEKTVMLWDMATGKPLHTLRGHEHVLHGMTFSPDGKQLATASMDKTIKVWDVAAGKELLTLKGHTAGVFRLAFSPDGRRLASSGMDRTVKLWDLSSGQEVLTLSAEKSKPTDLAFTPDGTRLVCGWQDGAVRIWEAPR